MGTAMEEIEVAAMTYIKNDRSLDYDMANRPALFYRRMWLYMNRAIPFFNKPPEMLTKLADYSEPRFDSVNATNDTEQSGAFAVDTGETGYDLVSAGIVGEDAVGTPVYTPLTVVSYAPETGEVQLEGHVEAGAEITFDFYASGMFTQTLNKTEIGLLAYCIYAVYELRSDNNQLERITKVRDGMFTTISEASNTQANTARQREVLDQLFDKLRAYEQNQAYMKTVLRTNY